MTVLPEKQKELLQTLQSMIEPHSKEAGCLNVHVYRDTDSINELALISEWQTRTALKHHMMSDQFSVLLGAKSLLAKPMAVEIFTISQSEGIEAMNSLRNKPIPKGDV